MYSKYKLSHLKSTLVPIATDIGIYRKVFMTILLFKSLFEICEINNKYFVKLAKHSYQSFTRYSLASIQKLPFFSIISITRKVLK